MATILVVEALADASLTSLSSAGAGDTLLSRTMSYRLTGVLNPGEENEQEIQLVVTTSDSEAEDGVIVVPTTDGTHYNVTIEEVSP